MGGGSHNYICYKIEEELVGQMKDIAELAHNLEQADSGETR